MIKRLVTMIVARGRFALLVVDPHLHAPRPPITQHQFDALVSFVFNTGKLANTGLLKKLNGNDYAAVPAEFMKWTKSKGEVLKGLVRRRKAEVAL